MYENSVHYSTGWVHSSYNWHKEEQEDPSIFNLSPMPIPKESSHETIDDLYSCREYSHGEKSVLRYQMMTPYHAKYFAYELTKRCPSDSMEKFASALVDAQEVRKAALAALTLEEKLAGQKQIKALESERGKRRRALFDAQDQIDQRRDQLIAEIEGKLKQKVNSEQLFAIRWQVRGGLNNGSSTGSPQLILAPE
jgi:hypothetical protein